MIDMKNKLKTIPVNAGKKDRATQGEAAFVVQKTFLQLEGKWCAEMILAGLLLKLKVSPQAKGEAEGKKVRQTEGKGRMKKYYVIITVSFSVLPTSLCDGRE